MEERIKTPERTSGVSSCPGSIAGTFQNMLIKICIAVFTVSLHTRTVKTIHSHRPSKKLSHGISGVCDIISHTRQTASEEWQVSGVRCPPVLPELRRLMQEDYECVTRLTNIIQCLLKENKLTTAKTNGNIPDKYLLVYIFYQHFKCVPTMNSHSIIDQNTDWDLERIKDSPNVRELVVCVRTRALRYVLNKTPSITLNSTDWSIKFLFKLTHSFGFTLMFWRSTDLVCVCLCVFIYTCMDIQLPVEGNSGVIPQDTVYLSLPFGGWVLY